MNKKIRIILYGDTLVLAGMRLTLEANQAFEVIAFSGPDAGEKGLPGEQELLDLQPDVVIFDTSSIQPPLHCNQKESSLQLIGIDPDRDQVLVWSKQHLQELSVQDLVDVIHRERNGGAEI